MNNDVIINRIAHNSDKSHKEVIATLKEMSANPEIKKQLRNRYGKGKR